MSTLLNLTNQVLIRLREPQVASTTENPYSTLVAEFVKQAVRDVEMATDWIQLRTTIQIPTTDGIFEYTLTGAGNGFRILDVFEDQNDYFLSKAPSYTWMNQQLLTNNPQSGQPQYYDINGVDANGDPGINVFPVPDGSYSLNFNLVVRTVLTDDADSTPVPELPVILRATFLAIEERGDDQGLTLPNLWDQYTLALGNAVAMDTGNYPDETVWYED